MSLAIDREYRLGSGVPITSANDIGDGKQFPPERERGRIDQMDMWYRWSKRDYIGLDPQAQRTLQRQFSNATGRQLQRLSPNMFRFVMRFWQDAIASDPPIIEYDGEVRKQQFIERVRPALMDATGRVVGDMVRYGVGVFYSRHPLIVENLDPRFWYPVRPAHDEYDDEGDVVAWPFSSGSDTTMDRVFVAKHTRDESSAAVHKLDGLTIGAKLQDVPVTKMDKAVVAVRTGSGFYGTSDFEDAAEYVADLHRRESAISEALDQHTDPHLAVPEGSLVTNSDGSVTLEKKGMVIPVPDGGTPPSYVVWDASFTAQENAISRGEQRILRMSRIAPILATPGEFALRGGLPSGAALRRLAVISVNRLRDMRESLSIAFRQVIAGQAQLLAASGGERIAIDGDKISVTWPVEFSTGVVDEADAIRALVDSGALTQETAIQIVERVSKQVAEEKASESNVAERAPAPGSNDAEGDNRERRNEPAGRDGSRRL